MISSQPQTICFHTGQRADQIPAIPRSSTNQCILTCFGVTVTVVVFSAGVPLAQPKGQWVSVPCPVGTLVFPASEMGLDGYARGEDGLPAKGVDLLAPNLCGSKVAWS